GLGRDRALRRQPAPRVRRDRRRRVDPALGPGRLGRPGRLPRRPDRVQGMTTPRRVVTGHTPEGVSVVVSDGPVPVSKELPDDGVAFHEVWNTEGAPARIG